MNFRELISSLDWEGGELESGYLVSGAVTLIHLVNQETGQESLQLINTQGMGAYTQVGIVQSAVNIVNSPDSRY